MQKILLGKILQITGAAIVIFSIMIFPYIIPFLDYGNEFLKNNEVFQIIKIWNLLFIVIFTVIGFIFVLVGLRIVKKIRAEMKLSVEEIYFDKLSKEKILDTVPIAIPKFLWFFADTYILCFTNKRLILYFFDFWSWHFQRSIFMGHFEKKIMNKEEELKNYDGDIEELISSQGKNFSINYEDVEKVSFLSIFFIRLEVYGNFTSRTIIFDFIVNNRKYVKSLFRKYLYSKIHKINRLSL